MNFKNLYRYNKSYFFLSIIFTFVLVFLFNIKIESDSSLAVSSRYNSFIIQTVYKKPAKIRIFCFVITSPKNFRTRTLAVNSTWVQECDKYFFITKFVEHEVPKHISYEADVPFPILQPAGHGVESYEKLTDKIYATLRDIYFRYNDYDWYLKADDDTFVFVDNLRTFLLTKNKSSPVTYGYDFQYYNEYHSGGAGYVISNEAMKRIGKQVYTDYSFCPNTGIEDVDVANCLRKLGVFQDKSIDDFGRERFHPFDIWYHFNGIYPEWFIKYSKNPVKKGYDCCSDTTISFHYTIPERMILFYRIWKHVIASSSSNFTLFIENVMKETDINGPKYDDK